MEVAATSGGGVVMSGDVLATSNGNGSASPKAKHAVVCGGGVIGACTAYFLGQKGVSVTLVEKTLSTRLACAASGKAGGFLAYDWNDRSPVKELARASFKLHKQLASELKQDYGYRSVSALSLSVKEPAANSKPSKESHKTKGGLPSWIDGPVRSAAEIGNEVTTAQVHPQLFTRAVVDAAVEKYGVKVQIGEVQDIEVDSLGPSSSRVTGVVVNGQLIHTDAVVLAMGPWSNRNKLISQLTTITGLKANSIVLRPKQPDNISPHCLFLTYRTQSGKEMDPEIYPRATGEVYVCGVSSTEEVPEDPASILPTPGAPDVLKRVALTVSSELAEAEVTVEQACFLPCSEDGIPVIGRIPGVEGAYIGTGHSCWGILNAPATGAALSELIADGSSSLVDLSPFDPQRFCVPAGFRR
eukprot:SM000057S18345  [mRNA]  locus=s57:98428:101795:+ [translate_table: standard]